jgi:hypothetical protein
MERRAFLKFATTTAAALAAQGNLPLLAAGKKGKRSLQGPSNCLSKPAAIEPITGYTGKFSPAAAGTMAKSFKAGYTLIQWQGAAARSKNAEKGSLAVAWQPGQLTTTEARPNRPTNTLKTSVRCEGKLNTAASWELNSSFQGTASTAFSERGTWDGRVMTVKSKSWSQESRTRNPLIARWALLPLLASGSLKKKPLTFDMLDDSTLRPNQSLQYEGEIMVPVKGGESKLHSYLQTGDAIVPTHYLVDTFGRVQLITMSMVSWALTELRGR